MEHIIKEIHKLNRLELSITDPASITIMDCKGRVFETRNSNMIKIVAKIMVGLYNQKLQELNSCVNGNRC